MRHAALHLPFDIAGVNGFASILNRCVAQHIHLAGFGINVNIADVHGETWAGTTCHQRCATCERTACTRGTRRNLRQRQRFNGDVLTGLRHRHAVFPIHHFLIDIPHGCGALLQLSNHISRRLNNRHTGGEGHPRSTGGVAEARGFRVRHLHANALVGNTQFFRCHERHRRARAADIRAAFHDCYCAVVVHVDVRAGLHARVKPETGADTATFVLAEGNLVVGMIFGSVQTLNETHGAELRTICCLHTLHRRILQAQINRVHT